MKTLLLSAFMYLGALSLNSDSSVVYICTGPQSRAYHAIKDCSGLHRCSEDVKAISLEKAKKIGRRPCRICL